MSKIFITGGAGYVGSELVPSLLESGHHVTVYDLMIYGEDVLPDHINLKKNKRRYKRHRSYKKKFKKTRNIYSFSLYFK